MTAWLTDLLTWIGGFKDAAAVFQVIFGALAAFFAVYIRSFFVPRVWQVQHYFMLHQYLSQITFADARRTIRNAYVTKKLDGHPESWPDDLKEAADRVCVSYDQAGQILLGSGNLISAAHRDAFLSSSWGQSVRQQFQAPQGFMKYEDAKRQQAFGHTTKFFQRFQDLDAAAKKYHVVPVRRRTPMGFRSPTR